MERNFTDNIDNSYWDTPRNISKNIVVHEIGLVEYNDAIINSNNLIDKIENLDQQILLNKNQTSLKEWSRWTYDSKNASKEFLCFSKNVPLISEINQRDIFYNEQSYISTMLHEAVDNALIKYYDVYPRAELNINSKERFTKLLKYVGNNFMPSHSDHGFTSRAISSILYLNSDYSGGELYFPYFNKTIKPNAGSVIMFPSNFIYTHEVKKMFDGTRYSFPNWFHNKKQQDLSSSSSNITRQKHE